MLSCIIEAVRTRTRLFALATVAPLLVWITLVCAAWIRAASSDGEPWVSLPPSGPGFVTYSLLGNAIGRQYLRKPAAEALLGAASAAAARVDGRRYVLAETGWRGGGRFPPHQSHHTGMYADVMVPLLDEDGAPAELSTAPWFLWGYYWSFTEEGVVAGLAWETRGPPQWTVSWPLQRRVDFAALADLLVALDAEARRRGCYLQRVILTPAFHRALLAHTPPEGRALLRRVLHPREAWVRHDEHVHVELARLR